MEMDRHFDVFKKRLHHNFLQEDNDTQQFLEDIQPLLPAIIILLVIFFRENVAIGRFIRSKNQSDKPLAENEALWLVSDDGAFAFMKRHEHLISSIRQRFSQEELLRARICAQVILFHENSHCFFVGLARGHMPTDSELVDDETLKVRWSFRLLLAIYSETNYQTSVKKEMMKMLPSHRSE